MALFRWYKKYSVNNTELDEHHKALFGIFNRLYDNCMGRNKTQCIDPIIGELVSYTNYHFSAEERYMSNVGYKDVYTHIIEHRNFAQRISQLQLVGVKDETQATRELIIYLGDWILHHIIEEDKNYALNL
jgi:hemerythrin-like metal-binding protein